MTRYLRAILAGLLCLASVQAFAAATIWNPYPAPIFASNGKIAGGAKAYFFAAGTTTPLVVYSDNSLSTPRTHPVVASAAGVFPNIYLPYGNYRVRVTDSSGVVISDSDGIANPAPPDSGGGGGIVVTADMVLSTGDVKWRMQTGSLTGFVRMNGRTIGSAASGATERANADTASLYAYVWNTYTDALAPVSGGRGASPEADFAANKTIVVPSMRGYSPAGLDDMGTTAANVAQRSTTISTTNLSTTATVASATDIGVGMYVVSANVQAGTTITAISGTTVTLSLAASATASGTAARFSYYTDAQVAGAIGGSINHSQTTPEVAAHTHTGSVSSTGTASVSGSISGSTTINDVIPAFSVISSSTAPPSTNVSVATSATTTPNSGPVTGTFSGGGPVSVSGSFTTASTGNGLPMPTLSPTRLGTWYLKL